VFSFSHQVFNRDFHFAFPAQKIVHPTSSACAGFLNFPIPSASDGRERARIGLLTKKAEVPLRRIDPNKRTVMRESHRTDHTIAPGDRENAIEKRDRTNVDFAK
jgi:hypothetical protein